MEKGKNLIPESLNGKREIFDSGKKKQNCTEFDNPFYCDAVAFNTYPISTITHAVCNWNCVEYFKNTHKYRGKKCLPNFVLRRSFSSLFFKFRILTTSHCAVGIRGLLGENEKKNAKKCCDQTDQKFCWHCVVVSFSSLD